MSKEGLLKDIDIYRDEIVNNHIDPFTKINKKQFFEDLEKIKEDTLGKNADEILVSLMKVNAEIGDEHTTIAVDDSKLFPFRCFSFAEGNIIEIADRNDSNCLYKKVVAINHIPISLVIQMISTLLPCKNEGYIKTQSIDFFTSPAILHGLNIIDNKDSVLLTLVDQANDTINTVIKAKQMHDISPIRVIPKQKELRYSNKKNYWYSYNSNKNYFYFKYAKCFDDSANPFSDFEKDFFDKLKLDDPRKIIIDMRDNRGGSEPVLFPFIKDLSVYCIEHIHQVKVYVLIGRETFSSAVLNILDLAHELPIITVGESTGGSINHFGEMKTFKLPDCGLNVSYSTKHFVRKVTMDGPIIPDIFIEETFFNYTNGIDSVLNYIVRK